MNAISFTKVFGGPNPLPQTLTITSTGGSIGNFVRSYNATGGGWLSTGGCTSYCGTPNTITALVNADAALPVGAYTGEIVVTSQDGGMAITVGVTLTVAPSSGSPYFDNLPGQMSFSFATASGNPPTQSVQIRNAGAAALSWTATVTTSDGANWLSVNVTNGTAPSLVTVGINVANLPSQGLIAGSFSGQIVFVASGSSVSIPISVTVGSPVFVQLGAYTFSTDLGAGNPNPQTLPITSNGNSVGFFVRSWAANGGNWLSTGGCRSYCGTPDSITALVTTSAITGPANATYTGEIVITANDGSMAMTIPVTLIVGNGGGTTNGGGALQFVKVTPCRVADTRNPSGPFGGPIMNAGQTREFDIPNSACGIPSSAAAYSLNVTVVPTAALGYLTAWPAGLAQPGVSTLNSDGRVKANAAIVPAGTTNGGVDVYVADQTHVIIDVDGYFVPTSALEFFPLTPCRIADTRGSTGSLGGPSLTSNSSRTFPVLSSACGIPSTAQAYSLNMTAVPHTPLGFLTTWPTGTNMPLVSTLNASTGTVTANAAIVPAGTNGSIDVFVTNASDLIIGTNGYFAPVANGGLSLYTMTPCRVVDTRYPSGTPPQSGTHAVAVESSSCTFRAAAQAYVLNATVVPPGAALGWLTLWPDAAPQPLASTLNAFDGAVTSNMAIVPTTNGYIDTYAANPTYIILDIASYFAP